LIYSFPLRTDGTKWTIVPNLPIDEEARKRLDASAIELHSEREAVKDLLGPAA
jgi:malate dehydrogenase